MINSETGRGLLRETAEIIMKVNEILTEDIKKLKMHVVDPDEPPRNANATHNNKI